MDHSPPKAINPRISSKRINEETQQARVALKHNGTLPSKLDIESFRATTHLFFEDSAKLVFELEFSQISLIEYVSPETSRNHLKKAEELCNKNECEEAITEVVLAFNKMIDDYENNKSAWGFRSPFFFGKDMTFLSSFHLGMNDFGSRKMADFVDNVKSSIESMQGAIKILALGLDYRKYSKFKQFLPHVMKVMSGDYIVQKRAFGDISPPDKEYVVFCINFIIECAIKLNEFNYEIKRS